MKKNNKHVWQIAAAIVCGVVALDAHQLRPIPWVTHNAVLFLTQFMKMHSNAKVLEFGSGSSTIWFAKRTKYLVSVEHSEVWFNKVNAILEGEPDCFAVDLMICSLPYFNVCDMFVDNYFDLILVDGRNRSGCIKHSIRKLKPGGVLMLDNAERPYYQKAIKLLSGWKCESDTQRQPDSCGFTYPNWTTTWWIKPK